MLSHLQEKPSILFLIAIALIAALCLITFYQFSYIKESRAWVNHTYEVIRISESIELEVNRLDAKLQTQFLLPGVINTFERDRTQQHIKTDLNSLIKMTADNPKQNLKIKEYNESINQKFITLNSLIDLKNKNQISSPVAQELLKKSIFQTELIEDINSSIKNIENTLLDERSQVAQSQLTFTKLFLLIGEILSLIFLMLAFILLLKELKKRSTAEKYADSVRRQLSSVINGSKDMIAAIDIHYNYLLFNDAYKTMFRKFFNKKIEIGLNLEEAFSNSPNEKDKIMNVWQQTISGNERTALFETQFNNDILTFEYTGSLVRNEDEEIIGAVHIIRDVTKRIQQQIQLEKGMEELKLKNEKISLLVEMSDTSLACASLAEFCIIVPKYGELILDFAYGVLFILHPSKDKLEQSANWGHLKNNQMQQFSPPQCWALRLGHIHCSGSHTKLFCEHLENKDHNTISFCIPLRAQTDIYGLLYLEITPEENHESSVYIKESNKLLMNAFAELVALALSNVRLRENLHHESVHDSLTGLYNRRYMLEFIYKQISQAQRSNTPLAIVVMDLDHFKKINDTYGHEAGDQVLKEIGRVLNLSIRAGDLAARYGGEEFIIVLINPKIESVNERLNNILDSIRNLDIKFNNHTIKNISASMGVSIFPRDGANWVTLFEKADSSLYLAKNAGRNRIKYSSTIEI